MRDGTPAKLPSTQLSTELDLEQSKKIAYFGGFVAPARPKSSKQYTTETIEIH